MTDPTPNPVFARKLADLVGLGYRQAGVLLSLPGTEPEQLVGITQFGKVAWWPTSAPPPDEMVSMIVDWLESEERSMHGALLNLGMALGTIRRLQQEMRNLQVEAEHYRLQALALLEREVGDQEP